MKVTIKWLREQGACEKGVIRFITKHEQSAELKTVINGHIKDSTLDYANWLTVRKMTHKQQIQYAIFAAEQVLNLYENKYDDDRPRKAIKAAKAVLKKNNIKNRNAAANAANAANAAYAAANAATNAANAAYAAANATNAANAAYAATNAAYAAAYAYAAIKTKIIKYGLKLIYKEA